MRILYPHDPLAPAQADGPYQAEYKAALDRGFSCSLFDFDAVTLGKSALPKRASASNETVLYRGWMLNLPGYQSLTHAIRAQGGRPLTSTSDYMRCHHLPNWYKDCQDLTANTQFFSVEDGVTTSDIVSAASNLGWSKYFVKDYAKSNTGDKGSIAHSPAEISDILEQLTLYRGAIEGGVALRQVEDYLVETESRYFVAKGKVYGTTDEIPELVKTVAHRIKASFYSVDVVSTTKGTPRLIELGDGQVSGLKNWSVLAFMQVLEALV